MLFRDKIIFVQKDNNDIANMDAANYVDLCMTFKLKTGGTMKTRNMKHYLSLLVAVAALFLLNFGVRADAAMVVVCGGEFVDVFNGLARSDDAPGTKYIWEKTSGSGELSGGTIDGPVSSSETCMRFYAAKTGDISIRVRAVLGNTTIRTAARSYKVINSYESYDWCCSEGENTADAVWKGYGSDGDNDKDLESKNIKSGSVFSIDFATWKDGEMRYETNTLHYPTLDDFTWKQTGKGTVTEISNSADTFTRNFKAVKPGVVTLTFATRDGKWSDSVSFRVHVDDATSSKLPRVLIWDKKSVESSFNGSNIDFEVDNVKGKAKNFVKKFTVVSSDNSIAAPGYLDWDKQGDGEIVCHAQIKMNKPGTVTISIVDTKYGEVLDSVELHLTEKIITKTWKRKISIENIWKKIYVTYGQPYLDVRASEGDTVKLSIGKKSWTKKVPGSDKVRFKIPIFKPGTKGKVTVKKPGSSLKITKKFVFKEERNDDSITVSRVTSSSETINIVLLPAIKGDVIKITAGSKNYTKKLKKTYYSKESDGLTIYSFKQKIGQLNSGTKIKIVVYNKYKQVCCKKTVIVE